MNPELRHLIDRSKFHRGAVVAIAALLPKEDSELDALIAEAVAGSQQFPFVLIVMAALVAGRPVDARHLAGGAMMLSDTALLGPVACHMKGDIAEPLMRAMEHTILQAHAEAQALFLMAAWCREDAGRTLPAGFIALARTFARSPRLKTESHGFMVALAGLLGDAGLSAVVMERFAKSSAEDQLKVAKAAKGLAEAYLAVWRGPVLEMIPAAPPNTLALGTTMRRSVAKVGRNDPCPCGSGKKHKHCCIAKTEERLHFSTDVAGKTSEEVRAEPEPHLTLDKLMKAAPHEAVRWDPHKIKPTLRGKYLEKLSAFHLLDRATEALELLGWTEDLKEPWETVMFFVTRAERRDLALRLMKLRSDPVAVEKDLHLGSALLLAADDPKRQIEILDECAMEALGSEKAENLSGFAYGLLVSRYRGLGIFVARSMIPLLPHKKASKLFEQLLEARDKLNLPPEDPFGAILEERFRDVDAGESKEADALRAAQARLDTQAKEVEGLKAALARLHKEIQQHEQLPPPVAPVAAPAPAPVEDPALRELRRKVEELRSMLNERHSERNELRRDLQKAHADLELLRQKAPTAAPKVESASDGSDDEEALFQPSEPFIHQPVRIIEFHKNFHAGLASLPKAVARGTLTMLGRLAAGEPAAFVGVVRLKAIHGIYRQRIGSEFRLLFKLLPDRVQVLDLVPRQDLLRRIKTLQ